MSENYVPINVKIFVLFYLFPENFTRKKKQRKSTETAAKQKDN